METFNEWIAYIYREIGYPENKIKQYEQSIRREVTIQNNQRWTIKDRRDAVLRKDNNPSVVEAD